MARRKEKRLSKEEKRVLALTSPRTTSVNTREWHDLVNARRAMVANLMMRRYSMAEMQITLAKDVSDGGLGVFFEDSILNHDMKYVREMWGSEAKRQVRYGLADQVAVLDYLERLALEAITNKEPGAPDLLMRVHDRRVHLLGLDVGTRAKLMLDSDGPSTVHSVADLLARVDAAQAGMDAEDTVDVNAE